MITIAFPLRGEGWFPRQPVGSVSASAAGDFNAPADAIEKMRMVGGAPGSDRSVEGPLVDVTCCSGGVGVLLEVLSVCVFASLLISAGSAWATVRATRAHTEALVSAVMTIERAVGSLDVEMPGITTITEAISDEISTAVEDVLGSMHVPTGADHLLATLSMGAQAFFARKFGPAGPGLASMIEGAMPPEAVGDAESVGTV